MVLGQYFPVDSFIHRLDPRTKFCAVSTLMMVSLFISNLWIYILFLICLFFLIRSARLPIGLVLRNLRSFLWLFILTFGIHLLCTSGQPLPAIGIGTVEGFWRGVFFCLRVVILIISAGLLTLTTSPLELTDGLEKLLMPLKWMRISPHAFALMLVIAIRFVPTFIEEANNIQKAQQARGANFHGNLVRRTYSLIPLLVPLFVSAFRRADELAISMEARNYRTDGLRTTFRELKFSVADYRSLVLLAIFIGGCLLMMNRLPGSIGD